jgi:glutamate synthase domain-containing protein 3
VPDTSGGMRMECTDKFGVQVPMPGGTEACDFSAGPPASATDSQIKQLLDAGRSMDLFEYVRDNIGLWSFDDIRAACRIIAGAKNIALAIETLTLLNDRRYATGSKKTSHIVHIVRCELDRLFRSLPALKSAPSGDNSYRLIDFQTRDVLREPREGEKTLVIDAAGFPAEGDECDAGILRDAYIKGWRRFITFASRGQRFVGCGLGPETDDVTIDVYGSSGDYLGSGIDGLSITVHGNAQDQLGQIIKQGKLVIHGDTGQTFMYGAKGGEVYVLGNAAGRPLINSVGRPKAVINGTCLDFLAESFMAGDPLKKGGFVILNGVKFDDDGQIVPLPEPYPGSNLFSLASGGAIYVRDPYNKCDEQQLNGGQFVQLTDADWELILPYLEENERLFDISVEDLLTVDGRRCEPTEVYRKVTPSISAVSEAVADTDDVATDFETAEQVVA